MWEKGDGGDVDGLSAVSDYVEQLRLGLIQQAAEERISWLESQFKGLVHKKSKDGKPSVVGIAQFLKLRIAHPGGGGLRQKCRSLLGMKEIRCSKKSTCRQFLDLSAIDVPCKMFVPCWPDFDF